MKSDPIRQGIAPVRLRHLIEEQRLFVAAAPALADHGLLERIGDLNRRRFLPLIERLLDEFDRPGELIRIDRLALDLGRLDPDLEGAEERLESALRAALGEAMAGRSEPPRTEAIVTATAERLPLNAALTGMFEHYLLHGTWPYGAGIDPALTPADCLARLIAESPGALVAMLRRRGADERLLRRLVRQMPEARLQALLHRLEPAHAAYVIAYLDDVRESHKAEPAVPATPAELDEMLWTIVLRDALRKDGLAANRKAFLRRLLEQLAAAGGVAPGALMVQLRRGLRRVRPGRPREPGSLLNVLAEIVAEDLGGLARPLLMAEIEALLRGGAQEGGTGGLGALLEIAIRGHPAELRWLVRRLAVEDKEGLRRRLEEVLPPPRAAALLADRGGPVIAPVGTALAALARLLDGAPGEDSKDVAAALERARAEEPIGTRLLLRGFALADAKRLRLRLAIPAEALAGLLLPPHLAASLLAIAGTTPLSARDWDRLIDAAGRAAESELPASLEARAWRALGRRRPGASPADREEAERLTRRYAALGQAAALWSAPMPFSPAERSAALAALLPHLGGIPPEALREALRDAGPEAFDPTALTPAQSRRFALLLAPEGEVPPVRKPPPPPAAPPSASERAALATLLKRLSPAALDRLIAALAPGRSARPRPDRPRWQLALDLALEGGEPWDSATIVEKSGAGAETALAVLRARLGEQARRPASVARALRGMTSRDLARTLAVLAPAGSKAGAAVRRLLADAPDRTAALRGLVADLVAGVALPPEPRPVPKSVPRAELALAARLKSRPLDAMRQVAAESPDALGAALPALLADPATPALLFAALPRADRERAIAIGRLLTGRAGRAAIAPSKVARALAAAVGSGGDIAAAWIEALMALASLSERKTLRRLLGEPVVRPAPPPAPEPKLAALRAQLRDRHKRAALVRNLSEGELVRLLTRLAPGTAAALLHAAERIAAARRAAGAGIPREAMWRALLAAAAKDPRDVAPLLALLLDGGEDVAAPPVPLREAAERLLRGSLEGGRDAPLRAALDVRRRERPPPPADKPRLLKATADPGAIHIGNAGLVLVSAFLPRLFRTLDFVAPDPSGRQTWVSPACRDRAVHLLQYLADGRSDAPEPSLALNKALCGMHPSEPVVAGIVPTEAEVATCDMLMAAILANWPPLRSSSPAALRETFFQREGRLAHGENGWTLEVERKVIDILVDQLPWGFSTILHPWMTDLITVHWA